MVASTGIITTIAGTGIQGDSGDGGAATSAQLYCPFEISVGKSGVVYIADYGNHKIRMVTRIGIITTIAGTGDVGDGGDGGAATSAQLNYPRGVSVDISGNVYIADTSNEKIRMVTSRGIITTIAGTETWGSSGDFGAATSAQLSIPKGVAVDVSGNVYIADTSNEKIRMVTSTGIITTIAGTGTWGSDGDGGAATSAQLANPYLVSVDISGNVYIADVNNNKIRMVTRAGIITTVAGTGAPGDSGDGGAATSAQLNNPQGVSVDISGNVYIAELSNNKIRKVVPQGRVVSLPTGQPSTQPSRQPTSQPIMQPTRQPTQQPSVQPSRQPSQQPTMQPSRQPSSQPSRQPTGQPTVQPSKQPTQQPTSPPSRQLSPVSSSGTARPSKFPTQQPTEQPSSQPTRQPAMRLTVPTPLLTDPPALGITQVNFLNFIFVFLPFCIIVSSFFIA